MTRNVSLTPLEANNQKDASAFGRPFNLRLSSRDVCLLALDNKRCPGDEPHVCRPPYLPHPSLFTRDGRPVLLVLHPYKADEDQIDAIVWYCLEHGFEVEEGTLGGEPVESFWSPNCVVVSIYKPGEF